MGAVLQVNNTSFMEQKILKVIFCVKRALKDKKQNKNKLQSISMCTNFTLQLFRVNCCRKSMEKEWILKYLLFDYRIFVYGNWLSTWIQPSFESHFQ